MSFKLKDYLMLEHIVCISQRRHDSASREPAFRIDGRMLCKITRLNNQYFV